VLPFVFVEWVVNSRSLHYATLLEGAKYRFVR
jgi:hypothetical protein